jgi:hypothetical protein
VTTTGERKVLKRPGEPMSEEALKEWQQAFIDIEESIEEMDLREEKENPNAKYLRMKQQDLF